eukprot:gene5203-6328_t
MGKPKALQSKKGGAAQSKTKAKNSAKLAKKQANNQPKPSNQEEHEPEVEDDDVHAEDLHFFKKNLNFLPTFSAVNIVEENKETLRQEKKRRRAEAEAREAGDVEGQYERTHVPEDLTEKQIVRKEKQNKKELAGPLPVKTTSGELHFPKQSASSRKGEEEEAEDDEDEEPRVELGPQNRKKPKQEKQQKGAVNAAAKQKEIDAAEEEDEEDDEDDWDNFDPRAAAAKASADARQSLQSMQVVEERRQEMKMTIAVAGYTILQGPEGNVGKIKEILPLCADEDEMVAQLAMLSLLAVYKDIAPSYRIRLPTEKELEVKVSKDVAKVRDYESALLKSYQAYLRVLFQASSIKGEGGVGLSLRATAAVKCMCGLMAALPHFNYFTDLLSAVLPMKVLTRDELSLEMRAQGVLAACDVLSGQGSALNVDPTGLLNCTYNMLQELHPHVESVAPPGPGMGSGDAGEVIIKVLQRLLCDRRPIDQAESRCATPAQPQRPGRLAAFIKRMAGAALHCGVGECMGFLALIRLIFMRNPTLRASLENEGCLPGVYRPEGPSPSTRLGCGNCAVLAPLPQSLILPKGKGGAWGRTYQSALQAVEMIAGEVKKRKCQSQLSDGRTIEDWTVDAVDDTPLMTESWFDADLRRRLESEGDAVDPRKRGKRAKDKKKKKKEEDEKDDVDEDMLEAEARLDPVKRRATQTETLEAIFEVYFRIVKYVDEQSKVLLPTVFAGLGKLSHLISVDFL